MIFKTLALAAGLLALTTAAPLNGTCPAPYGLNLPATYPAPAYPCNSTIPTHFSLHGYSFEGSIVNQSYYVGHYPNVNGYGSLQLDDGKYGSYAFGIGNNSHLFAANDGDISYIDLADETPLKIDYVNFLPWSAYWDNQAPGWTRDPIPVCSIVPAWGALQCSLNGTALDFGYCGDHEEGSDYWFVKQVVWGTDIGMTSACKKIVLRAEQVGKDYGHSDPAEYCKDHPREEGCFGSAGASGLIGKRKSA